MQTVSHKLKSHRANSTFGFLPTHKPTLKKTKRAVFFANALNDIENKELNLKTDRENTIYGVKYLETTKGNK
jgi:hypothetical protein